MSVHKEYPTHLDKAQAEKVSEAFLPQPKRQQRGSGLWLMTVCACVVLIDVLLAGQITVLVLRRRTKSATCPDPDTFCLPCKNLSLSAGENKHNFKEFSYDRVDKALAGDCCAESPDKLQLLIEIFVKRKQRIRRLTELEKSPNPVSRPINASLWRPAAHLVKQNATEFVFTAENKDNDLEWDVQTNSSSAFLQGFHRHQHRVIVLETGYYYVYSQLLFEEVANSSSTSDTVCHFLVRTNPQNNSEDKLLDNSMKLLGDTSKTHSSYLGAVFQLSQNDTIGVKVSGSGTRLNPARHTHGNFFGLYKI